MARRERQLSPEELALIKAQTTRLGAETAQGAADTEQRAQTAREQMALERALNESKVGLGREEIGSKEHMGQLSAALEALQQGSKENIAAQGERGAIASDLAKRADIPQSVLASALAESGQPGLFNALAREDINKREKAVNAIIPELQKPQSGGEEARVKKYRTALETSAGPGSYQEALARAYPKPGQAVPAPTPKLWEGAPPAASGSNWSALANTLLGKAGVNPTTASNGGLAPVAPELNYTGIGHGSLEGSKRTELASGLTQLSLPSGGTAKVFDTSTVAGREAIGAPHDIPRTGIDVGLPAAPSGVMSERREVAPSNRLNELIAPQGQIQTQPQLGTNEPTIPSGLVEGDKVAALTNVAAPSAIPTPTPPGLFGNLNVTTGPTAAPAPTPVGLLLDELMRRQNQKQTATY